MIVRLKFCFTGGGETKLIPCDGTSGPPLPAAGHWESGAWLPGCCGGEQAWEEGTGTGPDVANAAVTRSCHGNSEREIVSREQQGAPQCLDERGNRNPQAVPLNARDRFRLPAPLCPPGLLSAWLWLEPITLRMKTPSEYIICPLFASLSLAVSDVCLFVCFRSLLC